MANKSVKSKALREVVTLEQWVEVSTINGATITELFPSNRELLEKLSKMTPTPDLIYRRIFFRNGVPPEYAWVKPTDQQREFGGICIQRLTVDEWKNRIEAEAEQDPPSNHVGPSPDPRPKPKVRGECECQACQVNRQRLEDAGVEVL
jgi:hypothetical protein